MKSNLYLSNKYLPISSFFIILVLGILLCVPTVDLKAQSVGGHDSGAVSGTIGGHDPGTVGGTVGGTDNGSGSTFKLSNPLSGINSIGQLVQNFVQIFSYVVILLAVLMLIFTGFQYIMAQGNSTKISELHKRFLWLVVGIAIVIGARVIVDVVINTLSATGAVNQNVIQQAKNANSGN